MSILTNDALMKKSSPTPLVRHLIDHPRYDLGEPLHRLAVGHDLVGHRLVGAAHLPDRGGDRALDLAVGELHFGIEYRTYVPTSKCICFGDNMRQR